MSTEQIMAERVQRGVALLDERLPGWWRTDRGPKPAIDLLRLDLADSDRCVLGQLDRNYFSAVVRLRLTWAQAVAAGFQATSPEGDLSCDSYDSDLIWHINAEHAALTWLWREAILARRASADLPTATLLPA